MESVIRVMADGAVVFQHSDRLVGELVGAGMEISDVRRASMVEWNPFLDGWTVTSADGERVVCAGTDGLKVVPLDVAVVPAAFGTRAEALEVETKFFWELMRRENGDA